MPSSLREASYGLGATKWQTIWHHVLPSALPGILTGTILAVSRAIGETAPLVVVGASTFMAFDPTGPSPSSRPADPDLPVDQPAPGGVPQHRRGGHHRAAGAAAGPEHRGGPVAQPYS